VVKEHLSPEGLFVMQTVGLTHEGTGMDPWVTRHIFPNSEVPTVSRLSQAFCDRLRLDDWHNLGCDYEKTLLAWHENFRTAWPRLKASFDRRFFRVWSYYLLMFAGAFRARDLDLWQLVLAQPTRTQQFRRPDF
jgi:cyclopropane-fatty-acyl-phospholipid synthase